MATSLELAGVPKPEHVQYHSLMPLVAGRAVRPYDAIYGAYKDLQRSVTMESFKLILYPKIGQVLLYNVESDPHELHDMASSPAHAATIRRLFAKLLALQEETGDTLDLRAVYPQLAGS